MGKGSKNGGGEEWMLLPSLYTPINADGMRGCNYNRMIFINI